MHNSWLTNPPLLVFAALLAGVLSADAGTAPDIFLTAISCTGLSLLILRLRRPGMASWRSMLASGPMVYIAILIGVFASGALRVELAGDNEWAFRAGDGREVRAIVEVDRVVRRDDQEIAAIARVAGSQGPARRDAGARTTIRCFRREGARGSDCRQIVVGATLALRGRAVVYPDGHSAVIASGESGILKVHPPGHVKGISEAVDRLRAWLTFRVDSGLDGDAAWLVSAIVLGEGRGVPAVERGVLSSLGTSHLLSVSGLHVVAASAACGLLVALLLGLPASIFFQRVNVAAMAGLAAVVSAWAVSLLAGSPPSAVRAAGMATVFAASAIMRRRVHASSIMSVTGILNLLWAPEDGMSISFQLSYLAVFGILAGADAWRRIRPGPVQSASAKCTPVARIASAAARGIQASLVVSAGASLATMPLTVLYFNSAPLVSPVANLLIVPCFTFFAFPGAILVLVLLAIDPGCLAWSGVDGFVVGMYSAGVHYLMEVQSVVARIIPVWLVHPQFPINVAVAAGSAAGLILLVPGPRRVRFVLAAAMSLVVVFAPSWRPPDRPGVVFLDVGKGDASLVRCPSGQTWLIDAGPPPLGVDGLMYALNRARVYDIDGVVLTHAHDDHYGGIQTLVDVFGSFELVGCERTIDLLEPLAGRVLEAGGKVRIVRTGESLLPACGIDSIVLKADPRNGSAAQMTPELLSGENDHSLVFRLGDTGRAILFTGDLEQKGERQLMMSGVDLSTAILKAGHHGSPGASSSEFISAVHPGLVVVTGWPAGPRKGPGASLLRRFSQALSGVMSTAVVGDISVDFSITGHGKSASSPVLPARKLFPHDLSGNNDQIRAVMDVVKSDAGPQGN